MCQTLFLIYEINLAKPLCIKDGGPDLVHLEINAHMLMVSMNFVTYTPSSLLSWRESKCRKSMRSRVLVGSVAVQHLLLLLQRGRHMQVNKAPNGTMVLKKKINATNLNCTLKRACAFDICKLDIAIEVRRVRLRMGMKI